jgi:hypothetical protein
MTVFDPTLGPTRVILSTLTPDAVQDRESKGLLIVDGRRARSHYFDGRFLAARDLIREQNYVLTREADLAQSGGVGVIEGLDVTQLGARGLRIGAGQGITSAGEVVSVAADTSFILDDIVGLDRIDASSGLVSLSDPVAPADRTGVFVLLLRPVEYATQAITKYPTAVGGKRSTENGDIAEATALALIPYTADALDDDPWRQRSRIARLAFLEQGVRGIPAEALPLAMLRLDRGVIRWIDPYLVRRDMATAHEAVVGFGLTPRAQREAHLLQYDRQLREIVTERRRSGSLRFAATEYFEVLPAAGRMPAAAIDPSDFSQSYFPPSMIVTLTIVPVDELPMLLEDSLLAPPIPVAGAADDLDFTAIQVLIPAPREALRTQRPRSVKRPRGAAALPAARRPLEILDRLALSGAAPIAALAPGDPLVAQWRQMLAAPADGLVWFARRRTLSLTQRVAAPQNPAGPDE